MKERRPHFVATTSCAALALIAVALFLSIANPFSRQLDTASAGFVPRVFVNSFGNASDGDCEGPPNDSVAGGECTLREAIEEVNEGGSQSIGFVSRVFSQAAPGLIDLENGGGCLPKIARSGVTIDFSGASVIIDGDHPNSGTLASCQAAIVISISQLGFDFELIGNDNLLIRDLVGDGVALDCGPFAGATVLRNISITGVESENITGQTIVDACPTPTPTPTATLTATNTPTITNTPGPSPTPTITATPSDTPTITPTVPTLAPSDTPLPSDTPTNTPTRTSVPPNTATPTDTAILVTKGDANCDGVVSSVDASLVLQIHSELLDVLVCPANADIDHDGHITSLDASLILQVVAEVFSLQA